MRNICTKKILLLCAAIIVLGSAVQTLAMKKLVCSAFEILKRAGTFLDMGPIAPLCNINEQSFDNQESEKEKALQFENARDNRKLLLEEMSDQCEKNEQNYLIARTEFADLSHTFPDFAFGKDSPSEFFDKIQKDTKNKEVLLSTAQRRCESLRDPRPKDRMYAMIKNINNLEQIYLDSLAELEEEFSYEEIVSFKKDYDL